VYIYKRFDEAAIAEVLRNGLVAQLPKYKNTQLEYTAPKMFDFFQVRQQGCLVWTLFCGGSGGDTDNCSPFLG
jgi:hypothetical protein